MNFDKAFVSCFYNCQGLTSGVDCEVGRRWCHINTDDFKISTVGALLEIVASNDEARLLQSVCYGSNRGRYYIEKADEAWIDGQLNVNGLMDCCCVAQDVWLLKRASDDDIENTYETGV